jgi:hypothetical protein
MYAARLVGIDVFDTSLGANDYVFGPFSTQQLLMKHASALAARAPTTLRLAAPPAGIPAQAA